MTLTKEQKDAFKYIENGDNIFITSKGAGCGKTYLLNQIIQVYKKKKNIAITASTGIAAVLLNGMTLHSWAGIGLGKKDTKTLIKDILKKKNYKSRWIKTDILIIDEISLISPELFEKIDYIGRFIRDNSRPFGGIQLIVSGDWLQLPTVDSDKYAFQSKLWKTTINSVVYLKTIQRQKNPLFQEVLNSIRIGRITNKVKKALRSRLNIELKNEYGIIPTQLYSMNIDVEKINNQELEKLAKTTNSFKRIYNAKWIPKIINKQSKITSYFNTSNIEKKDKHEFNDIEVETKEVSQEYLEICNCQEKLELLIGLQVILISNLDQKRKLVNGSRGIIIGFNEEDFPIVKFINGIQETIEYHLWSIEVDNVLIGEIKQIPLKLGYASTIHKSQGSTLDYVIINLDKLFEVSQGYVGLSRVTHLEGLSIKGLDFNKFKVNIEALKFYEQLDKL